MPDFRYYLVTDRSYCKPASLEECVRQACLAGIKAVQLREKDLPGGELFNLAGRLKVITDAYQATLFVNDRLDIAMAVGAGGVHCPEEGLPPAAIRQYAPGLEVGTSVHSPEAAQNAEKSGAHFLLFGPVFPTRSKPDSVRPQGLPALRRVAGATGIPVFAIGGITPERTLECLKAGAHGVAGISSILGSTNINQSVQEYADVLKRL